MYCTEKDIFRKENEGKYIEIKLLIVFLIEVTYELFYPFDL